MDLQELEHQPYNVSGQVDRPQMVVTVRELSRWKEMLVQKQLDLFFLRTLLGSTGVSLLQLVHSDLLV